MKYAVKIKEILQKTIIVDVDGDFEDAIEKVKSAYENCEIFLDSENMFEVEFEESTTFGKNLIAEDDERLYLFTRLQEETKK